MAKMTNYINRTITESIEKARSFYQVITIIGPRQSGKTTLCKELFSDYTYINLEDVALREQISGDIKRFLNNHTDNLIIDEAHYIPELFSYIQVLVDENADRHFVLTGSSNFAMLHNITQSLAGRTAMFTILPFSLQEISEFITDKPTDSILINGFYPALFTKKIPHELFYGNYYSTYVERDVRQLINIKNIQLFQTFIRLCAGRVGSECNISALANEVGVSSPTINEWLSILEASFIVFKLPPYYENMGKRLIKTPKIFFYDVGLLCYLLGIEDEKQLSTHPLRGGIFENMVICELMKSRMNQGKASNLYFYRDSSRVEVDVLQTFGNDFSAYEIKSAQTFNNNFFKNLKLIQDIFNQRVTHSTVIYDGQEESFSQTLAIWNFRNMKRE